MHHYCCTLRPMMHMPLRLQITYSKANDVHAFETLYKIVYPKANDVHAFGTKHLVL